MKIPQVTHPVTRSLRSWKRGQGGLGCDGRDTCSPSPPHLVTPSFILNVLAQPCGSFLLCSHDTWCTVLARGLPKPDLSPQHHQGTLRKEGIEGRVSVWLTQPGQEGLRADHVRLQLPAAPAFFRQKRTVSTRDKAWEQPKGPSTEDAVKMWHAYTVEYFSTNN